jgi:hypothetical protein
VQVQLEVEGSLEDFRIFRRDQFKIAENNEDNKS